MLKPKVVKLILEELEISALTPFSIEGESTPYRLKKDGNLERFKGQTWIDSSYSYLDLVALFDNKRLSKFEGELIEYSSQPKEVKRRKRK